MATPELPFADDASPQRFQRETSFFSPPDTKPKPSPPPTTPRVYTISQLNRMIKLALNTSLSGRLCVSGELSAWSVNRSSGHAYATLKDAGAVMDATMWKSSLAKLKFKPAEGMAVIATGTVDFYEPRGTVKFILEKLEPAGLGALELAFQQLKEKLQKEGFFAEARKKPLPVFPQTIAIVTSPDGEAIKDIEKTLNQRWPGVRKLLYPVAVQGEGAAGQIAAAINDLNRRRGTLGGIDVMIVGRGGGSLEDLWAFNEDVVARAIFASAIPVISAVGHEGDVSIADLVADARAATPTAAAVLAVPDRQEILEQLRQTQQRLKNNLRDRCLWARESLRTLGQRPLLARPRDRINTYRQLVDEKDAQLARQISERRRGAQQRLGQALEVLRRIEPHTALHEGRLKLQDHHHQLRAVWQHLRQRMGTALEKVAATLRSASPQSQVDSRRTALANYQQQLGKAWGHILRQTQQGLTARHRHLASLDPRAVLQRGYSITRHKATGKVVAAQTPPMPGEVLTTELAGRMMVESQVTNPTAKTQEA